MRVNTSHRSQKLVLLLQCVVKNYRILIRPSSTAYHVRLGESYMGCNAGGRSSSSIQRPIQCLPDMRRQPCLRSRNASNLRMRTSVVKCISVLFIRRTGPMLQYPDKKPMPVLLAICTLLDSPSIGGNVDVVVTASVPKPVNNQFSSPNLGLSTF